MRCRSCPTAVVRCQGGEEIYLARWVQAHVVAEARRSFAVARMKPPMLHGFMRADHPTKVQIERASWTDRS